MKAFVLAAILSASFGSAAWAVDLGISQPGSATLYPAGATVLFVLRPVNAGTDSFGAAPGSATAQTTASASAGAAHGTAATTPTATVIDTLATPAFSQLSATGSGWSCSVAGSQITCLFGHTIAGGQAFPPITVSAKSNSAGSFQNCAAISFASVPGTTPDTIPANNNTCLSFAVQAAQTCLTNANGSPRFITGSATDPQQANANQFAQNNWSAGANAAGSGYGDWNRAASKNQSCSQSTSNPFTHPYTCNLSAQPCR